MEKTEETEEIKFDGFCQEVGIDEQKTEETSAILEDSTEEVVTVDKIIDEDVITNLK